MIATVPTFVPSRVRRHAGIAATVLVHAVLILLWQMTRQPATGATLLEQARRAAGGIDRALRKENNPYIVAPLDSPQIRMRKGIAAAAHMEPGMDELVNNTGDGARRTRVVTGGSTYCMTERSPATSIDMIEKHGKWRQTNCPGHESTANGQEWRTARD
jgi:hypothetical protein